jgi:arylsulfatase
MVHLPLLLLVLVLAACAEDASNPSSAASSPDRPNILLIVVDDMGFADLGSFGGEIDTPNLDRLAYEGIRFSNFNSATVCSPARAMMLTGVDSHLSGFGNLLEEMSPNQQGLPGYEGYLNDRVVTLPTLLRDAGYRTYMAGKWHLGSGAGKGAAYHGFEKSFVLDSAGASHFADMRPAYAPSPDVKASYWENGVKLEALPDDFDYSSQFYVDRMIEYLEDDRDSDAEEPPFFAYLSFTAPHWPLQAPDEAIARQAGRYDDGYDALAETRLVQQMRLGILPIDAVRSSRSPKEVPWEELDDEQQKVEIRAMEIYAAMIEEVDRHTGRLIDLLESQGKLDNTLVVFLSDNGPEGHDLDETWSMDMFPEIRKTIDATHDFSYESMGREGSYVLYGPNWANAGSPAFRLHKGFPTEGGTRVAAFVRYPKEIANSAITDDFVFIADVTPTILDMAGIEHPGTSYQGREIEPMTGRSIAPLIRGEGGNDTGRVTGMEVMGKRAIRVGIWKLMHMPSPWGNDDWQLFNLADDPGETRDLSGIFPDRADALKATWEEYAQQNGVILPDWVSGY